MTETGTTASYDMTALGSEAGSPTGILVDRDGLRLQYPDGKEISAKWPGRLSYWLIEDYRELSPPPPPFPVQGLTILAGWRRVPLTGEAIDGVLSAAKEAGLSVTTIRIDSKSPSVSGRAVRHYLQPPGFFNTRANWRPTTPGVTAETR